jgi:exonuclease SbcC
VISEVLIHGFRGIPDERHFQLGRLTFLSGRNGLGKTTFFDAIDWCLFGHASRLGDAQETLTNLYGDSASPLVTVHLSIGGESDVITRTTTTVTLNGAPIDDRELLDSFIADRAVFPPHSQDVAARVRSLVYLEQATIRSLISAAAEDSRTELFQALLGIPHVSTVRAAIRKVTTAIDTKIRRVEQQLEEVEAELQDPLVRHAKDRTAEIEGLRASTQRFASVTLDASAASLSVAALQSRCRVALDSLYAERARLAEAGASVEELGARLASLGHELEASKAELARLMGSEAEARQSEADAHAGREAVEERLAEARRRRDVLASEAARIRSLAAHEATVGRLQAELSDKQTLQLRLAGEWQSLATELSGVNAQTKDLMARIGSLRVQRDALAAREQQAQRVRDIEARRMDLLTELGTERNVLASEERMLKDLTARQTAADGELVITQAAYEQSLGGLDDRQRIAALVVELGRLAERLHLAQCPTCGADYKKSEVLVRLIDATRGRQDAIVRAASDAKGRADEARTAHERASVGVREASARIAAIRTRIDQALQRLEALEAEENSLLQAQSTEEGAVPEGDVATALAEEERSLAAGVAARAALEARLLAARNEIDNVAAQVSGLEKSMNEARRALLASPGVGEVSGDAVERDFVVAEEDVRIEESALREAVLSESRAHDVQTDVSARRAAATEALHRMEARLHTTAANLTATIKSAVGPNGDLQAITEAVRQVGDREDRVRALAAQVQELAIAEAEKEVMLRARALTDSRQRMAEDLKPLNRGKSRFQSVAAALLARASKEEAAAFSQQRSAIQECYRALVPHKHLDEVTIDPQSGAVFISDYLLERQSRQVRAHEYLSTGQANALAVAMFVAIALRQRVTGLDCLLMDEPVQNLDDLHFLAFMSLAKRVALDKQVIFSTADSNIAEIFRRQMKSSWSRGIDDYAEYEWTDFAPREGPTILARGV